MKKFKKVINFDMDGTIADFYGVPEWLDYLHNEDTTPYTIAKPLVNCSLLARYLNKLQKQGYTINIISWTSKTGSTEFMQQIEKAKKEWLHKHLKSVTFDNICIVPYGVAKNKCINGGILFDDNADVRREWRETGIDFDETAIMDVLKLLVQ